MFKNIQYYQRVILLVWVGLSAGELLAATDCNQVTQIPISECQSLLELYNNTNGANWKNNTGWNQTNTPCSWFGVTCNEGYVESIFFNDNNLVGVIPNLNLPNLGSLFLGSNQLSGSIPNFNNSPKLILLYLSSNQLSGSIPNFTNLPNLLSLSLDSNQLSGSIPNFTNLPKLQSLFLDSNQLSGSIPNFTSFKLANLVSVSFGANCGLAAFDAAQETVLNQKDSYWRTRNSLCKETVTAFSCNNVTEIPVSECQSLVELYNSTNGANWKNNTGWNQTNTPCSWFGVTCYNGYVEKIDLSNNGDLNNPIHTQRFSYSNNLVGTIPDLNLPNLTKLSLSLNYLSGSIPNFTNLPKLQHLYLNYNQLSGSIPNFTSFNLGNLSDIKFNNNCGLTAYDSNQEAVLDQKDSIWKTRNPNCPTFITAAANPVEGGSISCNPNPVAQGSNSVCTAIPNTGYTFNNFSGDCNGTSCTLDNVTSAKNVTANFIISKVNQIITFNPALIGVIGTTVNLSATASSGLTPITFTTSSPTVCTINGNVVSFVSEGNCIVTANQAGNANYNAAALERIISSTVGIFDIKVSYYDTYDNAINRKEQIEDNIRHWADGVYESTNGAHRLGKVEINTNGANADNTDVLWVASCWPNARIGGRGKAGARIQYCDTFPNNGNPISFLQRTRSGGYTMTHEWGHFAYALFDEYKSGDECSKASFPCKSDVGVSNSIMHNQWNAVGANETLGDLNWLNFSTKINNDGANITTNAQARVYKASAWETLVRDTSLDPINFGRAFYKGLVAVAPAAGQAPSIELGTYNATTGTYQINTTAQATAREKLSFVWKGASTVRRAASGIDKRPMVKIIAIENSANIHPQQLATVKIAANQLIRKAEIGDVIAVAAFASETQIVSSFTLINSEEDKKNIIQSVKSIQPSVLPPKLETVVQKISDMVQTAIASFPASHPLNQYEKDIYLFAQGFTSNNGESIGLGDMISKANDSNIRIFSFALNETTEKTLRVLSEMTHGKSWFTPTLESLRDALSNLLDAASPMLDVIVAADQATFSSNKEFPFLVDSTLGELSISIYYSGTSNGTTLSLVAPDGTMRTLTTNECPSDDNEIAGKNSCLVRVSHPVIGDWKLRATTTNSSGINVSFDAHALPLDNKEVFFASVNALPKITAPNKPVIVEATVSGNAVTSYGESQLPITHLTVSGVVKKPNGTLETLTLHDDGTGNDKQANDGVYTASLTGEISGEYLV
ncbi:MAG: hypothetical protein RIT27_2180 [Pseudomonadota bacterium]